LLGLDCFLSPRRHSLPRTPEHHAAIRRGVHGDVRAAGVLPGQDDLGQRVLYVALEGAA